MKKMAWASAYLVTAALGLGLAYAVSSALMAPARAQAPSDGSLPAEFMQEIENGKGSGSPAPPAGAHQPVPGGNNPVPPPPPTNALPQSPPAVPQAPPQPAAAPQASPPVETQSQDPNLLQGQAPAAGTAVSPEEYVYDPTGRRDPFRPYRIIRTDTVKTPVPGTSPESLLEPLQRYDLDQLAVMGILWDVRQPRALLRDGDGRIHTIVKNTKLGRNSGYVAAIREGEVVVIESIDDESGKVIKRTRVLEFKK